MFTMAETVCLGGGPGDFPFRFVGGRGPWPTFILVACGGSQKNNTMGSTYQGDRDKAGD